MSRSFRLILHAGFALSGVLTTMLGPMLPALSARWLLNDSEAGRLFTAQFLGALVGALLAARLALHIGTRLAIASGFALSAAGVIGAAISTWPIGLLSVGLWGLGLGIILPSVNLLVAQLHPGRRTSAVSLVNFAWGVGAVAAPPVIAAVLRLAGFQPLLLGLAGFLAATAVSIGRLDADLPPVLKSSQERRIGWRSSFLWLTGVFLFLYVGVENSLAGWIPSYGVRVLKLRNETMAIAQAGFWGAILSVRLLASLLLRGNAGSFLIVSGLTLGLTGMAILVAFADMRALFTGALLAGAGLAAVFPTAVALFVERARCQATALAGVVFAMASLGGAVIPWAVGCASTYFQSLRLALAMPLVCSVCMIIVQMRLSSALPRDI